MVDANRWKLKLLKSSSMNSLSENTQNCLEEVLGEMESYSFLVSRVTVSSSHVHGFSYTVSLSTSVPPPYSSQRSGPSSRMKNHGAFTLHPKSSRPFAWCERVHLGCGSCELTELQKQTTLWWCIIPPSHASSHTYCRKCFFQAQL